MKKLLSVFLFVFASSLFADEISWTLQENANLPEGAKLYKGTRTSPKLNAWYLDVDLNVADIAIRPYKADVSVKVSSFVKNVGAYAAINGGFFGGSTSYSSVIYPGAVKAINVQTVTRNSKAYPVLRSMFSLDSAFIPAVDWIYHFGNALDGVYTYDQPLDYGNNDPNPKSTPLKDDGQLYDNVLLAIGGGPTLVKNGQANITYNQEIMWGSGVGLDNRDPRTAVGFTADNHIIMFVADGRQTESEGVSLIELAEILIGFGCIEAMNLDGGGSTQMADSEGYINSPSEQRSVPTILAIVHKDSLGLPKNPILEKVLDTRDDGVKLVGDDWFETSNSGFWGETPSLLNQKGDGSSYAEFKLKLDLFARYDVFAWWVASSNRCTDTPFIIKHITGIDTVYKDQTKNGSEWAFVGNYIFNDDTSLSVVITDGAKTGTYVVADAIRVVATDTTLVSNLAAEKNTIPKLIKLSANYPNPFNNSTVFNVFLAKKSKISVSIFNTLGQKVESLFSGEKQSGNHTFSWNAQNMTSGIYYISLSSGRHMRTQKALLLK